jgi:hypothetical protein
MRPRSILLASATNSNAQIFLAKRSNKVAEEDRLQEWLPRETTLVPNWESTEVPKGYGSEAYVITL